MAPPSSPISSSASAAKKGAGAAAGGPAPLPCLYSNNCDNGPLPELKKAIAEKWNQLSSQHRKTAWLLRAAIVHLAVVYGLERIGFLTLTFADLVTCPREAQRRFHNLARRVLAGRFRDFIRVLERCDSGRIHYHLVVVLPFDLRTGVDFAAFKRGDYRSAGPDLRREWAFWRATAPRYGFGRTELLPVKSTAEGVSKYVGKYIAKHIGQRQERDKGVRLVSFTKGAKVGTSRFAWASPGAWLWRAKVAVFASCVGVESFEELGRHLGPRWAFRWQDLIMSMPVPEYPTVEHFEAEVDRNPVNVDPGAKTAPRQKWGSEDRDVVKIRVGDPEEALRFARQATAGIRARVAWNQSRQEKNQ